MEAKFSFDNQGMVFPVLAGIFGAVSILVLIILLVLTLSDKNSAKFKRDKIRQANLIQLAKLIEDDFYNTPEPKLPAQDGESHISTDGSPSNNAAGFGWIPADFSPKINFLPVDPVNDGRFFYRYYADPNLGSARFKVDAAAEADFQAAINDGGVDPGRFEVGTDKTLLPP